MAQPIHPSDRSNVFVTCVLIPLRWNQYSIPFRRLLASEHVAAARRAIKSNFPSSSLGLKSTRIHPSASSNERSFVRLPERRRLLKRPPVSSSNRLLARLPAKFASAARDKAQKHELSAPLCALYRTNSPFFLLIHHSMPEFIPPF